MSIWNGLGSGSWSTAGNWLGGVPDSIGATADFSNLANANLTHHIDLTVLGPYTVGNLLLTSSAIENYSLENSRLVMSNGSHAAINVTSSGAKPLSSILASSLTLQLNSDTTVTTTGAATTLDAQSKITGVGTLVKEGTGTLRLASAASDWSGGTDVGGGQIEFSKAAFGSGEIRLSGGGTALRASQTVTLDNDIVVNQGSSPIISAATGKTLTLHGAFHADGNAGTTLHFGKTADKGTILFDASSVGVSGSGAVSVDGGTLKAGATLSGLLGAVGGVSVAAGATLDANGTTLTVVDLSGAGKIINSSDSEGKLDLHQIGNTTFSGIISNGAAYFAISKSGAGTLTLSGANTFNGGTSIIEGTLRTGADNVFNLNHTTSIEAGAVLDLSGHDQTVGGLLGEGTVAGRSASSVTLGTNVSTNSGNYFYGVISDGSGVLGDLNFVKSGGGTQGLGNVNTYTGTTTIAEGIVELTSMGSIESSSGLTIEKLGTFDISQSASGATVQTLVNHGQVELMGKALTLSYQSGDVGGTFVGGAGVDKLSVHLANGVSDVSLWDAKFSFWTDASDKISLVGNGAANSLIGSSHADIIDGGLGTDTMKGGAGNDAFTVDTGLDKVIEAAGTAGGTDTVKASATYALGLGVAVERLETTLATGTNAFNLVGNEFAQTVTGNDGANVLGGGGGNDVISARGGADAVQGGLGNDTLAGNGGNDGFYFNTALNAATNVDRILDFGQASGNADLIRLDNAVFKLLGAAGFLDPDFFKANATGTASDGNDHIIYETDTGKLFYDTNGDMAGGSTQFATITNFASLTGANALSAADFYVY